ncbi:hypothetical protein [Sphingopyxis sp. MWB1]|uniref:hypothetical protein n=1 Tax=Sphingopyxis sp. MWB1 TaxID=1537715 RepID=UPI00051A8ACD|nr:hypothetical protein [Sphingopyxis sp. MWB1]
MKLFSNVDITGGFSDFWDYIRQPRPHRWPLWGLAVAISLVIFYGLSKYIVPYERPKPQIIYFENWTADRSESDVRADWVARAKETTRRNAERRAQYQKLADMMGVEYDSAEADKVTRETLGPDTDEIGTRPNSPQRSTLAERAARGPQSGDTEQR